MIYIELFLIARTSSIQMHCHLSPALIALIAHTSLRLRPSRIRFTPHLSPLTHHTSSRPTYLTPYILGLAQLIAFIGVIEFGFAARKDDIEAAQLTASGWDQATIDKKLAIELNNGRAAQMGILALMIHEKLDNNPYIINSLLGSPVPFN
jgi:hypothetical protein